MAGGWLIGVMVEANGEPAPVRHYYAVGCEEQAKAEWRAVDLALQLGGVAAGPVGGLEPVEAIRRIPPQRANALGLRAGQVVALGWKHPRRWLA
jgi:hypothetical protein